jgi:hypothetical protein
MSLAEEQHQLAGVRAKIRRAKEHIVGFYYAKKAFLESSPFTFSHSEDVNTGRYNVFITNIKPVPLELSLIIGDAIHNLRSALDLLACQLVKLNVGDNDCNHIYFPISESASKFIITLSNDKIKVLGKPALEILKQLQPYQDGKHHDLWVLHRLDIQDKHRLLIVVPTSIYSWHGKTVFVPSSPDREASTPYEARAAVPEDVLFIPKIGDSLVGIDPSYFSKGMDGEVRVHFKFEGDIAFNEPSIVQSKSASNTLHKIVNAVEDTVNQFEPVFSR